MKLPKDLTELPEFLSDFILEAVNAAEEIAQNPAFRLTRLHTFGTGFDCGQPVTLVNLLGAYLAKCGAPPGQGIDLASLCGDYYADDFKLAVKMQSKLTALKWVHRGYIAMAWSLYYGNQLKELSSITTRNEMLDLVGSKQWFTKLRSIAATLKLYEQGEHDDTIS